MGNEDLILIVYLGMLFLPMILLEIMLIIDAISDLKSKRKDDKK